ncbi:hypothetical protein KKHLCK_13310 [Candidatus Electrothrix laxa]
MRNKLKLEAIDFFCGAGGVTCGFKQAGIDVLGGIDIDKTCRETYEKNNGSKFLCVDISKFNVKILSKYFNIKIQQDNLIFVGCSPCQYFSNIKTDKQKASKGRLLLADFQKFIEYYRPGYVFIENVPGFEKKKGSPLGKFKTFLLKRGYRCDDASLNAKHFGVPQNRRRYILLASRIKTGDFSLPDPDKKYIRTVRDAIGDYSVFNPLKAGESDKTDFIHSAACLSALNITRIRHTPKDGGDRRSWRDNNKLQLKSHRLVNNLVIELIVLHEKTTP